MIVVKKNRVNPQNLQLKILPDSIEGLRRPAHHGG